MLNFFKRTYENRNLYKMQIDKLAEIVVSFESNELVTESFFDQNRYEGFFKGKMFYITYEMHQTPEGVILEVTTTCKIPFNVPKTYTTGFFEYINMTKR